MVTDKGKVYGICDADRIDFLEDQTVVYDQGWIFRLSVTSRGMRLHDISRQGASPTVREVIDVAIREAAEAAYETESGGDDD